jgi:hypothetical protein
MTEKTEKQRMHEGDRAAHRVIMMKRPTKAAVAEVFERTKDDAAMRAGAENAFFRQGPRLWAFWVAARDKKPATRRTAKTAKKSKPSPTHAAKSAEAIEAADDKREVVVLETTDGGESWHRAHLDLSKRVSAIEEKIGVKLADRVAGVHSASTGAVWIPLVSLLEHHREKISRAQIDATKRHASTSVSWREWLAKNKPAFAANGDELADDAFPAEEKGFSIPKEHVDDVLEILGPAAPDIRGRFLHGKPA